MLGGAGIFAGALSSGVAGGSRLLGAAVPMGLLVLLGGGGLALVNSPWRKLPTLEPKALAPPILEAMAAQGGREKAGR